MRAHTRQGFIPSFSSPQRLAYVHVVEEATNARDHKGQLLSHTYQVIGGRFPLDPQRVIQTPWSFHKSGWRASKNLYPSRSKAEENLSAAVEESASLPQAETVAQGAEATPPEATAVEGT
jgi:hypothetical protein